MLPFYQALFYHYEWLLWKITIKAKIQKKFKSLSELKTGNELQLFIEKVRFETKKLRKYFFEKKRGKKNFFSKL